MQIERVRIVAALMPILAAVLLSNPPEVTAQEQSSVQKKRIAVRTPDVGDAVSAAARRHLDLSVLTSEIEASLQSARKFELVSRQKSNLGAIREEQKLAESELFAGNAAPTGRLENADYVIVPTVQAFEFYRSTQAVPNIENKFTIVDRGNLKVAAQILDTASGSIRFTFDAESHFATRPMVVNARGGVPASGYFESLSKEVAAEMVDQLVETVFPMMVLNVQRRQIWINRGADGGLVEGDELRLYQPGEDLIDPYTKENLGSAEVFVGNATVVRVAPKFTVAEINKLDSDVSVEKGFIVRKP